MGTLWPCLLHDDALAGVSGADGKGSEARHSSWARQKEEAGFYQARVRGISQLIGEKAYDISRREVSTKKLKSLNYSKISVRQTKICGLEICSCST